MVLALLKRKEQPSSLDSDAAELYDAFVRGLELMEQEGVDRVPLIVHESEPAKKEFTTWETSDNYHPFDSLPDAEKDMIAKKTSYTAISLVLKQVGYQVTYPGAGIEHAHRSWETPVLPKLNDPEGFFHYNSNTSVSTGDNLMNFARSAAAAGLKPAAVDEAVKHGITEYKNITSKLLKNSGVYEALEKMELRRLSPFDQIMDDMHVNMAFSHHK
jgi:hypothetical protein|tara:strand:+ start:55 stop:699 length:645 start_codon:yes stop_codon:yes gene_type:complete